MRYAGQRRSIPSLHPTVETASCGVAICVSYLVLQRVLWDIRKHVLEALVKKTYRNHVVYLNSIPTKI